MRRTIVQSNQYDYIDWIKYLKKPSYSKLRQIHAENLLESMYSRHGSVNNEDLLEIMRDEPIICRSGASSATILFMTRESFGIGNPRGPVGKIPFSFA